MTAKDYRKIAEALKEARPVDPREGGHPAWVTWDACVETIAGALKRDNPRFDRERFAAACE